MNKKTQPKFSNLGKPMGKPDEDSITKLYGKGKPAKGKKAKRGK